MNPSVRDSSGKPGAQRGLAANSPTQRGTPKNQKKSNHLHPPVETRDAKGALSLQTYDVLSRPIRHWARDRTAEAVTLRQHMIYGDAAGGPANPDTTNHRGKLFRHYDEAGLQVFDGYDFKGNVLSKYRLTIKDSLLQTHLTVRVDWTPAAGQTLANRETFYLELKAHRNATNTDGYRMDYSYDALNRIKSLVVPLDVAQLRKRLEPRYNKAGALEKVTLFPDHRVSTGAKDYIRHIAYNARGQEILMACGSTLMQRKVYDPLTFRLSRVRTERFTLSGNTFSFVTGTVRQDSTYTYDRAGNITQLRETSPNSGIASNPNELIRQYQYDALYRLLSAKGREWDNKNQTTPWAMPATANLVTVTANARLWERLYDYDLMGNLLRMRHVSSNSPNSFTRLYNPDASNQMVTQFGANNRTTRLRTGTTNIDYLYDASGNMTRESTNRNLEYDQRQLTRLYMISTSGYEHYQYGAGGELVKRFSRSGSEFYSNVEIDGLFQYNNRLNIATDHQNKINVLDSSGNTVAQRRMGSALGEAAYASDELYMLHNHTGSIIGTYDLNGAQQEGEDFYPFGETAHNWNGNKMHRFGGKLRSFSSGFYLFGARQYAPWLAKFTSVDPLAAKSTDRNPYHYASNNPINRVDPSGMEDEPTNGGNNNSSNKLFINGHKQELDKNAGELLKASGKLSSAKGKLATLDVESPGYKKANKAFEKAQRQYNKAESNYAETIEKYSVVESVISKVTEASKNGVFKVTKEVIEYTGDNSLKVGDSIDIVGQLEKYRSANNRPLSITVTYEPNGYFKPGSSLNPDAVNDSMLGVLPIFQRPASDANKSTLEHKIRLFKNNSSIANEIGDFYFRYYSTTGLKKDVERIMREPDVSSYQEAYDKLYFSLNMENFSSIIQKQYSTYLNK